MAKILLIDDEKALRQALGRVLESVGHEVCAVSDGLEGIKKLSTFKPDLVITDILMPNQDGIGTILELQRIDPLIPIVAISGSDILGNVDFLSAAQTFGATAVIRKPFRAKELIATVEQCLKKKIISVN